MLLLIRSNLGLMLQCQADIIETVQQAVPDESIDGKLRSEPPVVTNLALFEIDHKLVVVEVLRTLHQIGDLILGQTHREESIFRTVIGEDVGKRRRDDGAESEISQRPYRVFA